MNTSYVRWSAIALVLGLFAALSSGCVVPGDRYGYDASVGIGVGYYEPYWGPYYGAWGPSYYVGPIHGGNYRPYYGRPTPHTYRQAPGSRPVPSIPARRRGSNVRPSPLR